MEKFLELVNEMKWDLISFITQRGLKLLAAVILIVVGFKLIKLIMKLITKAFVKSKMDISLAKFSISLIRTILKISLILIVTNNLVIDITPIVAVGAAAGVGVGMALQGSLANLTGGMFILILRPFSVGDYIFEKAFDNEGRVEDIQVFYTTLLTKDNRTVMIPNGQLANSSVINYSRQKYRRIDIKCYVDYSHPAELVKETIYEVAKSHPLVCKDKEIFVGMGEHGESSVVYDVWVWCETPNYTKVKYALIEQIKKAFDEKQIKIPYPHLNVIFKNPKETGEEA